MWTLSEGLELIRTLQPQLHARKYHVALGGGVLNKGESTKDLDLYFFPFDDSDIEPILPFLVEQLGTWQPLWAKSEVADLELPEYPADVNFGLKVKFMHIPNYPGKRIDAFITHNGVNTNGR